LTRHKDVKNFRERKKANPSAVFNPFIVVEVMNLDKNFFFNEVLTALNFFSWEDVVLLVEKYPPTR
jgi:hypothetical protein